jgi:hypothetical protein
VGLLAAAALIATAVKAMRDGRGRRWVTEHVELRPATREEFVPGTRREQEVRSDSVRLHMHEEPGWTTGLEVKDADHRADPADDGP